MFFPKKPFLKKFLTFCKIELSRSQLKKLFIFHKNGAFLYFLKKKKRFFLYFRRKLSKLKKISSLKFFFKFQEMELSLYFLKKSFFFYFRRGLSVPILQNFLQFFPKKLALKKFILFQEMELSSPNFKNLLIFQKMELSYIFSRKAFSYILENETFLKDFLSFTREISSLHLQSSF